MDLRRNFTGSILHQERQKILSQMQTEPAIN
jgi:hypothetical protein